MRNAIWACSALALVLAIVSINLWRELRIERMRAADEQGARTSNSHGPEPWRGSIAALTLPSGSVIAPELLTAPAQSVSAVGSTADLSNGDWDLLEDPEYRRARVVQLRMMLPQNYPGLVEELGLTPEEAEKLFELLAEYQLEGSIVPMPLVPGQPVDLAALQQAQQARTDVERRQEAALSSLLGDARYVQWQEYGRNQPAFLQVVQFNRSLETAGIAPLSEAQQRSVRAALIAERRREEDIQSKLVSEFLQGPGADPSRMQELVEGSLKQHSDRIDRILETAGRHLDARQMERLKATLEQELIVRREQVRAGLQRAQAQGVALAAPAMGN